MNEQQLHSRLSSLEVPGSAEAEERAAAVARAAVARKRRPRPFQTLSARPRHALAVAFSIPVLLGGVAYAMPPTRTAIDDLAVTFDDLTDTFADWASGDGEQAPGRALRPEDDAPDWVREAGGRLIAETAGVELYVTRRETEGGTVLEFVPGKRNETIGLSRNGWRRFFADHAVLLVGRAPFGPGDKLDERGRYPLLGVTARSVTRVELRYARGPALVETGVDGGFVLLADAWRPARKLVAYDASGRVLDRVSFRRRGREYDRYMSTAKQHKIFRPAFSLCEREPEPGCLSD